MFYITFLDQGLCQETFIHHHNILIVKIVRMDLLLRQNGDKCIMVILGACLNKEVIDQQWKQEKFLKKSVIMWTPMDKSHGNEMQCNCSNTYKIGCWLSMDNLCLQKRILSVKVTPRTFINLICAGSTLYWIIYFL